MLADQIERIAHEIWQASPGATMVARLCDIAAEVRQLEAREQARLSARAYSTSGTLGHAAGMEYGAGGGAAYAPGRWIRPGEEVDHQSLRDGDPPYIAGPECEEPR